MKHRFALFLLLLASSTFLNAQKVAHLNFDSLISMMPESKVASEAANNYLKGLESELVSMRAEFDTKYKDFSEKEAGMGELLKKNKQQDLQQLQKRIQDFQASAEQDFRIKQSEIAAPIFAKAKAGVAAVAKEMGYRYVLDTSIGRTSVLYSEASDDILGAVKKKLINMPMAPIPGAAAPEITKPAASTPGTKAK